MSSTAFRPFGAILATIAVALMVPAMQAQAAPNPAPRRNAHERSANADRAKPISAPVDSSKGRELGKEPASEKDIAAARSEFAEGMRLASLEKWGEALERFRHSLKHFQHPDLHYNVGICHRALGHYVAAQGSFQKALSDTKRLNPEHRRWAQGYVAELNKLIVLAQVVLKPAHAAISVDGRPLRWAAPQQRFLSGVEEPGAAKPIGKSHFEMALDPGVHVLQATRPGHRTIVVRRTFRTGEPAELDLRLDLLPAKVKVRSAPGNAIVRVAGREVGVAPLEFQRPAGKYSIEVLLADHETYETDVLLKPGQQADLVARLKPEKLNVLEQWWFWGGAAAVLAGGAVTTWALTRPEPQPPPYDGGTTEWVVQPEGFKF